MIRTIAALIIVTTTILGPTAASSAVLNAEELKAQPTQLSQREQAMIAWIDARAEAILAELKTHVEINTGTDNIVGLDQYRGMLEDELTALGFATQKHASAPIDIVTCEGGQITIADHLTGTVNRGEGPKLLLNGHMDTVFSPDDEFQSLAIGANGALKGPGVADMKGGIVVMLNALRALDEFDYLQHANMTVMFNSDEEIGSLGSRTLIEALAKQHDLGFIFEPTYQQRVVRARKGLGQARVKITGRESHAGGAHEDGVSANLELAYKIIEVEQLTDYERGLTVNTGVIGGGEKRNTIPGCADAYIDMRFPDRAGGEELQARLQAVADATFSSYPKFEGLPKTEFWSVLHRPVKPPHPKVDELIAEAMGISALVGEPIVGARYSGGGTDGSIAQGVGLPTIDSLGLDGSGAHSSREESTLESLIARVKLAAVLLGRHVEH